jgi:hypothetical protein
MTQRAIFSAIHGGTTQASSARSTGIVVAFRWRRRSGAKRIALDGPGRTVIDGTFAATRELVAGFGI